MSMEAAVLIDLKGRAIHWHLPPGRSMAFLPDARDLWDVIWENRENISGLAHSHPGSGIPGPSMEDLTTFAAIESALGKRLKWWICSLDELVELQWHARSLAEIAEMREGSRLDYRARRLVPLELSPPKQPWRDGDLWMTKSQKKWLRELRDVSYEGHNVLDR